MRLKIQEGTVAEGSDYGAAGPEGSLLYPDQTGWDCPELGHIQKAVSEGSSRSSRQTAGSGNSSKTKRGLGYISCTTAQCH